MELTESYDPLGKPNADTNRLSLDAGWMQFVNAKIVRDCVFTVDDDSTATPDVQMQFKDVRGRPLRGHVQAHIYVSETSWEVLTSAPTVVLSDDNGLVEITLDGEDGTYYVRVEAGGQLFQSGAITVAA